MLRIFLLATCLLALIARPPTPSCSIRPLAHLVPITFGELQRFDLEDIFSGYNLQLKQPDLQFANVQDKYTVFEKNLTETINFRNVKIQGNSRFLGISGDNSSTVLYLGMNSETGGVTINKTVVVENVASTTCYDVEEIFGRDGKSYAVVDCGIFNKGVLALNQFYFIDLTTFEVLPSSHFSDVFINFNSLSGRSIHVVYEPFNDRHYLYKIIKSSDVDQQHQSQTYVEIFDVTNPLKPYLLEIIDHTVLEGDSLAIADFKFIGQSLYLLAFDRGVFEISVTPAQKLIIRNVFRVKMDYTRLSVSRLGFDDDISLVLANNHAVYLYEWIIGKDPVLASKFLLLPETVIEQMHHDQNFIIFSATSYVAEPKQRVDSTYRKLWVFSRDTGSYADAFLTFGIDPASNLKTHFHEHAHVLTVFEPTRTRNFKFSLPFIQISPQKISAINQTYELKLSATSTEDSDNSSTNCEQTVSLKVLDRADRSIINSGIQGRGKYVVDSPDDRRLYVERYFFGPWLEYTINTRTTDPNASKPTTEVDKTLRNILRWTNGPAPGTVIFLDFFTETDLEGGIYGFVQDISEDIYYVQCLPKGNQLLNCTTKFKTNLNRGRILNISQVTEPLERRVAFLFSSRPSTAYVYTVYPNNILVWGQIAYTGTLDNQVTSISIKSGLIMLTFALGKRVDVYRLEDIKDDDETTVQAPRFRITAQVMKFFGVPYFAPIDAETNPDHPQVLFLKTKTGLMIMNVNMQGFPTLLFQIPVHASEYAYEVSRENILIITSTDTSLYQLQIPLRANAPFYLLQSFDHNFTLGTYSQLESDQFFYLSDEEYVGVIHPGRPSSSIFYDLVKANSKVTLMDAVHYNDREYLFALDSTGINNWEFYFNPSVAVNWNEDQLNFDLDVSARNNFSQSNVSTIQFTVFNLSEASIVPSLQFNKTFVENELLLLPSRNDALLNISIDDREWFNGSILHYTVDCQDCNGKVELWNHVHQTREILAARAIFDLQSTFDGIFAQQYNSIFKTYVNDSIEFIVTIPTTINGEPCVKIAVPNNQLFSVSLCQTGQDINLYLTTYATDKPFTMGPSVSAAKQALSAKVVERLFIIVDAEDNPFARNGGVYLYHMEFDGEQPFSLLDVIDGADLQMAGFTGPAYITSADLHNPYLLQEHYRMVLTEGRTGGVFILTFTLSKNRRQIIYLSRTYIDVHKYFDPSVLIPDPLRILTATILSHTYIKDTTDYRILLTVANWHHIELALLLNNTDDSILLLTVDRLYERYPWDLKPYVKVRHGADGFFAVPYYNNSRGNQIVAVYDTSANSASLTIPNGPNSDIPVTRILGAHWVRDNFEVNFAFNESSTTPGHDNLVFVDVDSYNLTELKVSRNLTLWLKNSPQNQTLYFTAINTFHNYTFDAKLSYLPEGPDEEAVEIIWIIILVVGFLTVICLVLICVKQIRKQKQAVPENKQSLIMQDDSFKNAYINRSSVDPTDANPQFRQSTQSEQLP